MMGNTAAVLIFIITIASIYGAGLRDGIGNRSLRRHINNIDSRGSCLADGIQYSSEAAIPRDHPCHYCLCYQSKVACYWKQCGAPPRNCEVMNFPNVCNPSLYVCEIPPEAREEPQLQFGDRLNSFRFSRRKRELKNRLPVDEIPPVEFEEAWKSFIKVRRKKRAIGNTLEDIYGDTSCIILGIQYLLGEVIGVASDICMECRCAAGSMFCSPKCCFQPAPFSFNRNTESQLLLNSQSRRSELRSHPLQYIKNQYTRDTFL